MTDKEYAAFLEDTKNIIISVVDCCESVSDLLKVTELKMMIAKELHETNDYYDPANYDGLTTEEISAMRKDTEWEACLFGQARQSWDTRLFLLARVVPCMSVV